MVVDSHRSVETRVRADRSTAVKTEDQNGCCGRELGERYRGNKAGSREAELEAVQENKGTETQTGILYQDPRK
jgi:hypothetical protein